MIGTGIIGVIITLLTILGPIPEVLNFGGFLGLPDYFLFGMLVSTMLIGVGFLIGPFYGSFQLIAAVLGYWIVIPFAVSHGIIPAEITPDVTAALGHEIGILALARNYIASPLGIGAMLGSTIISMLLMIPGLSQSIKELFHAERSKGEDVSGIWLIVSALALLVGVTILAFTSDVSLPRSILGAIIALIWIFMASAIVAVATGLTDTSPISGMALIAGILMVFVFGIDNIYAIIMIACTVCVAAGQAADVMEDLRAGYLVGTNPRRQEILKFPGPIIGAIVGVLTVVLLANTYGIGNETFPAPQASVFAGILNMIKGGEIPYLLFLGGGFLGAAVSLTGLPGVLIGLGIYLPFYIPFTVAVGGWLKGIGDRFYGKEKVEEYSIPSAAGLIIGEALTLIGYGIYTVVTI